MHAMDGRDNTYGSRHLASKLKQDGTLNRVKALVLYDMIGDKDLNVTVNGSLIPQTFDASRAAGFRDYFAYGGNGMLDDHEP